MTPRTTASNATDATRTVDDAAAQLRRLLLALPALADGEAHQMSEVAAIAGTSPDAVARDLRTLVTRYDNDPGGFIEGVQLAFGADTVRLRSKLFRRPMGLTPAELAALELGLTALQRELPPHEAHVARKARERIAKAAPGVAQGKPRRVAHAVTPGATDADGLHLSRLREAINTGVKARINYRAGSSPVGSERSVHPYGLVHDKRWYLVAFCDKASAIRIFRLDRMLGVTVLNEPADVPNGVDIEETLQHGRALVTHAEETLRVKYSAAIARWISEHEQVEAQSDGSVIVNHPLLDDEWAVRHVLQYGPDALVLEPARVRALVRNRLRLMLS